MAEGYQRDEGATQEAGRIESAYYRYMHYDSTHARNVLSYYVRYFEGQAPVLELGPGRGEFLGLLRENGISGTGVDNDAGMVEQARVAGENVVLADVREYLASAEGSYGGIFCSHFIEHFTPEDVARILSGVRNALRPGGVFVAVVPNPACYAVLTHDFWRDPTHVRFYDPDLIGFLCVAEGLSVETTGTNPKNHPGPPPWFLADEPIVHPDLDGFLENLLSAAPSRNRDAAWNDGVIHLFRTLQQRLSETQEALKSHHRALRNLVNAMYEPNDVYVVARRHE